jgi:hypothetical protein
MVFDRILKFLFSNDFIIIKLLIQLLVLIGFGKYSAENRIYFQPTLTDCLSFPEKVEEGKEVVFSGVLKKIDGNNFVTIGKNSYSVSLSKIVSIDYNKELTFVGRCTGKSAFILIRWEDRGNAKNIKYVLSILSLILTFGIFFRNFKLSLSGIVLR